MNADKSLMQGTQANNWNELRNLVTKNTSSGKKKKSKTRLLDVERHNETGSKTVAQQPVKLSQHLASPENKDQPRKKSMEEWENRLSGKKEKIPADILIDRIIEQKKKEIVVEAMTASADDLLDLEYQSVHSGNNSPRDPVRKPVRKKGAATESDSRSLSQQVLLISPLLTAQQSRQKRYADTRPKSCDLAHLRLRRNIKRFVRDDSASSMTSDEERVNKKLGRRKKSKSENLSEDQRFSENELRKQRKIGIGGSCKISIG